MLFGQMYVAPAVTRFAQRYPKVQCRMSFADRVVNLLEEDLDVGVRIGPLADSTLVAQTVGHIRRVVVATPALLRHHGVPRHPDELAHIACIRVTGSNAHWWTFQENDKEFQVPVMGNLEFNQTAPAVAACAAGAGFGHFLSYQVDDLVRQRQLRIVLENSSCPPGRCR